MLLVFIGIYLILTLSVGWYAARYVKSSKDFALAGRKMPVYVVASGLFATWFGSETIMGASSEFLQHGLLGVIEDPFGAALCLFLIGWWYARPLYRLNLLTFSDYFNIRYSQRVELISAFFMIPSYFSWIAAQLIALAVVLQAIAGIPLPWGVSICAAIVLFYTYVGGMWSVSITDTIQTLLILMGLVVLAYTLVQKMGGWQIFWDSVPSESLQLIPQERNIHSWLIYLGAWITLGWGSIPQQDVFQRVLSAKSERVAVQGAYLSSFAYLTIAMLPLIIVWCGAQLYPTLVQGDLQLSIPQIVLQHASLPIQVLFFGALLSAILSTCSGAILAPATVVAENIIKPLFGEDIPDRILLKTMRYSVILITLIAVGMSFISTNIYTLVGEASALSLVALFVPLTVGLYWKRGNALGAILSMFLGTGVWVYMNFIAQSELSSLYGLGASALGMVLGIVYDSRDRAMD